MNWLDAIPYRSTVMPVLPVYVISFVLFSLILVSLDTPFDQDGYFHLRIAESPARFLGAENFPWMSASIYNEHYADKCILYHLMIHLFYLLRLDSLTLLIPAFTGSFLLAYVYYFLRRFDVRYPCIWTFLVLLISSDFFLRLLMIRPHVLSIVCALICVQFLLNGNYRLLAILAFLYVFTYSSYHLLLMLSFLYVMCHYIYYRRLDFTPFVLTFISLGFGILLHPHFPDNFIIWKVNTIDVFVLDLLFVDLDLIVELLPAGPHFLLLENFFLFFPIPGLLLWTLSRSAQVSFQSIYLLLVCFIFLCMTMFAVRFIEYWALFSVLTAAFLVRDLHLTDALRKGQKLGILIVVFFLYFYNFVDTKIQFGQYHFPDLQNVSSWIKNSEQIQPGEIIFHDSWDYFPQLFYFNTENRYLFGLDPIFLFAYDREKYETWRAVSDGSAQNIRAILEDFNSRVILIRNSNTRLHETLLNEQFHLLFEDEFVSLFAT
ncbi:MAG: hypothetical protein ACOX5R_16875 [bacterium]|jgi:hypothetical protein